MRLMGPYAALVAVGLGGFGMSDPAQAQEAAGFRAMIRENVHRLEQDGRGGADTALVNLVAVLSRLSDGVDIPESFHAKVATAESGLRSRGFIDNDQAFADLLAAYEALSGGQKFAVPAGVTDRDDVTAFLDTRIAGALSALDAGLPKDAMRELMEFILMILTPMDTP